MTNPQDNVKSKFWERWLKADELEKVKLVLTLTLPSPQVEPKELYEHHCATLINSYLVDAVGAERGRITTELANQSGKIIDDLKQTILKLVKDIKTEPPMDILHKARLERLDLESRKIKYPNREED